MTREGAVSLLLSRGLTEGEAEQVYMTAWREGFAVGVTAKGQDQ